MENNGTAKTVQGQLRVLATENPKLYDVEIWALNSEVNRNGWKYINLAQHLDEFLDIPLLTAYVGGGMVIGDGHNYNLKRDPATGEEYASFTAPDAERIVGWVPKDRSNVRLEMQDGIEWVVLKGSLWAWYAKELVDQIARQGRMEVSIETLILKEHQEEGVDVEEEYLVLGVTILGNGVTPAVAGAKIQTLAELSELRSNMAEQILKAASFIGEEPEPTGSEDPENEPKTKENNNEGVTKLNYFSRKQLAELEPKFPEMKVLAAASDEQGIHVCLMAADGATSVYTMESDNATIVPEKMQKVNAQALFNFGGECDMSVDLCDLWDTMSANVIKFQSAAEKAEKDLEAANATIKAMQDAENKRRVQAAKDMAKSTLDKANANREDKYSDEMLTAINADIDAGMYTERCNSDGEWIGAAEVETRVLAECARQQSAIDEKLAQSKANTFILDKFNASRPKDEAGIGGLLARMGKK